MSCNQPESNEATEIFSQPSALKDRAFIEIPCPTSWEKMTGNDSVRFCGQCSLNVYNISSMTDKEAEAVFAKGENGERLCARLYRRPDGTVMTDNCPRALRRIRNGSRWLKTKIVACFGLLLSFTSPAQAKSTENIDSKNGSAEKSSPNKNNSNKDKSNQSKTKAEKSANGNKKPLTTAGAVKEPAAVVEPEVGRVGAPQSNSAAVPPNPGKTTDWEANMHKTGKVSVHPLPVKQVVTPTIPATNQQAK